MKTRQGVVLLSLIKYVTVLHCTKYSAYVSLSNIWLMKVNEWKVIILNFGFNNVHCTCKLTINGRHNYECGFICYYRNAIT